MSSGQPHLTLKWTQDAKPATHTLFISNINLQTAGGPGNNCGLDQLIDFGDNGYDTNSN